MVSILLSTLPSCMGSVHTALHLPGVYVPGFSPPLPSGYYERIAREIIPEVGILTLVECTQVSTLGLLATVLSYRGRHLTSLSYTRNYRTPTLINCRVGALKVGMNFIPFIRYSLLVLTLSSGVGEAANAQLSSTRIFTYAQPKPEKKHLHTQLHGIRAPTLGVGHNLL